MNTYSGFRDKAYSDSSRILANVKANILNNLSARGITEKQFYAWMKNQGVTELRLDRLKKYPENGTQNPTVSTDHLAVICLCATFMELSPEEVMFKVLTPEQHKLRMKTR